MACNYNLIAPTPPGHAMNQQHTVPSTTLYTANDDDDDEDGDGDVNIDQSTTISSSCSLYMVWPHPPYPRTAVLEYMPAETRYLSDSWMDGWMDEWMNG